MEDRVNLEEGTRRAGYRKKILKKSKDLGRRCHPERDWIRKHEPGKWHTSVACGWPGKKLRSIKNLQRTVTFNVDFVGEGERIGSSRCFLRCTSNINLCSRAGREVHYWCSGGLSGVRALCLNDGCNNCGVQSQLAYKLEVGASDGARYRINANLKTTLPPQNSSISYQFLWIVSNVIVFLQKF